MERKPIRNFACRQGDFVNQGSHGVAGRHRAAENRENNVRYLAVQHGTVFRSMWDGGLVAAGLGIPDFVNERNEFGCPYSVSGSGSVVTKTRPLRFRAGSGSKDVLSSCPGRVRGPCPILVETARNYRFPVWKTRLLWCSEPFSRCLQIRECTWFRLPPAYKSSHVKTGSMRSRQLSPLDETVAACAVRSNPRGVNWILLCPVREVCLFRTGHRHRGLIGRILVLEGTSNLLETGKATNVVCSPLVTLVAGSVLIICCASAKMLPAIPRRTR